MTLMVFVLLLWVKCFFDLLVIPLFYNFGGCSKSTYLPINLEFRPLEVARPSLLAFEPSSTYTLIGLWCRSTSKTLLIVFLELLFVESCVMLGGLWQTLSPLPSCFMVLILLFITSMGCMWRGSPLLNHKARWPFKRSFIYFGPLSNSPKDHLREPPTMSFHPS
jgi:hypothetical protein